MTGHVIPFDAAAHKVADVLLPWFVNGTLAGEDLAFVKRHLEQCVRCQREVEWLRELHAACVAGEAMPGASATFRNLRRQLEKPSGGRDPMARPRGPSGRTRRWWPWAIATEFAVIIVMGSLLISGTEGPALYRTLGTNAMAPATASLVIVFDPATTEAEVRRILRSAGARIVDGPTQANAYVLDVPAGQIDRAAQTIREERAAVLVERLAPNVR